MSNPISKANNKNVKKVGDGTNYVGMVFLENLINPNPTKILQKYTSKSSKHKNCDRKWGKGQILLEWFSKYIKQKKGENVGELSNYVGMNFLAKETTKMW